MRALLLVCLLAGVAAAAPCARRGALARLASAAFPPEVRAQGDGSVMAIDPTRLRCTRVRASPPRRLLTFDTGDGLLVALVSGTTVIWERGQVSVGTLRDTIESAEPADLDGDGVDELLIVDTRYGHEQSGGTTLSVMDLAATAGDFSASLALGDRNGTMPVQDGGWSCEASWKLERGRRKTKRIVTVGSCQGSTPNDFPIGKHVHALRSGQLIEISAASPR
jgi:hypothetical protein